MNIADPLQQLVVYLGCLHQSRINRGKADSSVYGAATDGFRYVFVAVTHEGLLKESKHFNISGELPVVLGCLRYILEKATSGVDDTDDTDEILDVNERKADDSDDEDDEV